MRRSQNSVSVTTTPQSISVDLTNPSHDVWSDCPQSGTTRPHERAATLWEELLAAAPSRCAEGPADCGGSTWSGYFNTLSLRRHVSADFFACETGLMQPPRSLSADYENFSSLKDYYPQGTSSPAAPRPIGFSDVVSALDPRDSPNSPLSLDLSYACSVCHLRFATVHALGGHKSVHNVKTRPQRRTSQRSSPRRHSDKAHAAGDSNPGNRLEGDVVLLVDAAARLATCTNQDSPRERDPTSQMHHTTSGMSDAQPANSWGSKEGSEFVNMGKRAALLSEIRGLLQLKRQRSCSSYENEEFLGIGDRDVLRVGGSDCIPETYGGAVEMDVVDLSLHL
ncbi:unnamed protein product [Closterium sp. Yama58-4]|nr:unnamed protein product [Closterium sp. Yama58-4]